jgi:aquaporin Z
MSMAQRVSAEVIGTFWLVFGGCGSAVIAASYPELGVGFTGVALAFGLAVLTMAYAVGHISGCHLNPAVSIGLVAAKRFSAADLGPYVVAQLAGGALGAVVLYLVAIGRPGFEIGDGFAANGYGLHSPGGYSLAAAFLAEAVLTGLFLVIIVGATDGRAPKGFAPIAIGLGLTLIHLISIPVTNTSVNPARSTATALITGGWALQQLWLFWIAPVVGATAGGVLYRTLETSLTVERLPPVSGEPKPTARI